MSRGRGAAGETDWFDLDPEMITPEWMHSQITAAEYESWSEEQCAGIEIVDGMIVVRPRASKQHNRLARIPANADTIDVSPTRPEHVLLVAEIVSPGSETTDRIVKHDQYARAGIEFYWRESRPGLRPGPPVRWTRPYSRG